MTKPKGRYEYFVSYNAQARGGTCIDGNCSVWVTKNIDSIDDIRKIEKFIEKVLKRKFDFLNVVIINYILLK